MIPGIQIILWHFDAWGDVVYSPSMDFSNSLNSQYFVMGWP